MLLNCILTSVGSPMADGSYVKVRQLVAAWRVIIIVYEIDNNLFETYNCTFYYATIQDGHCNATAILQCGSDLRNAPYLSRTPSFAH